MGGHPEGGSATEGSVSFAARFFTTLRFVQNDLVVFRHSLTYLMAAAKSAAVWMPVPVLERLVPSWSRERGRLAGRFELLHRQAECTTAARSSIRVRTDSSFAACIRVSTNCSLTRCASSTPSGDGSGRS